MVVHKSCLPDAEIATSSVSWLKDALRKNPPPRSARDNMAMLLCKRRFKVSEWLRGLHGPELTDVGRLRVEAGL